jgi:hypothetical protein
MTAGEKQGPLSAQAQALLSVVFLFLVKSQISRANLLPNRFPMVLHITPGGNRPGAL